MESWRKADEIRQTRRDTGILGRNVRIKRNGFIKDREGVIVGIYSTRKEPSFKIQITIIPGDIDGRVLHGSGIALKRHEFDLV